MAAQAEVREAPPAADEDMSHSEILKEIISQSSEAILKGLKHPLHILMGAGLTAAGAGATYLEIKTGLRLDAKLVARLGIVGVGAVYDFGVAKAYLSRPGPEDASDHPETDRDMLLEDARDESQWKDGGGHVV